jgi:hypothetical protein
LPTLANLPIQLYLQPGQHGDQPLYNLFDYSVRDRFEVFLARLEQQDRVRLADLHEITTRELFHRSGLSPFDERLALHTLLRFGMKREPARNNPPAAKLANLQYRW